MRSFLAEAPDISKALFGTPGFLTYSEERMFAVDPDTKSAKVGAGAASGRPGNQLAARRLLTSPWKSLRPSTSHNRTPCLLG
eukprot:9233318-Lingulodinium_polyedra.AAC.1